MFHYRLLIPLLCEKTIFKAQLRVSHKDWSRLPPALSQAEKAGFVMGLGSGGLPGAKEVFIQITMAENVFQLE